jgi:hypothetical protein
MRKLKLNRKPIKIDKEIKPEKRKDDDTTSFINKTMINTSEYKRKDEISLEEYIKSSNSDKLTLLKIILFLIFVGIGIFVFYHAFFGENGFISQSKKAYELNQLEFLKKTKEKEFNQKSKLLSDIKNQDFETIEKEARKKGYIYQNETVFKLLDENNKKIVYPEKEEENSTKTKMILT